jgi:FkbM family methyltransferase
MSFNRQVKLGRFIMSIRPAPLAALIKALLRVHRVEAPTAEGTFWLDPASYLGLTVLEHRIYEPDMLAVVKHFVPDGGTFVDVGANEGYFSVVAARAAGATGRVLAVEPQHRLHAVLRKNFDLNRCSRTELAPYAVSDQPGEAALHLTPGVNNSASSLIRPTRYPLARQTVQCLTLADIFCRHSVDTCDLLKIDIEGWEYEAVLGSPDLFRSGRVKALALELHPPLLLRRGLDSAKITDFLAECGYRPWSVSPNLVLVHASAV